MIMVLSFLLALLFGYTFIRIFFKVFKITIEITCGMIVFGALAILGLAVFALLLSI